MSALSVGRIVRLAARHAGRAAPKNIRSSVIHSTNLAATSILATRCAYGRALSTTSIQYKGITPDSEDPKPSSPEPTSTSVEPMELTNEQYHEVADLYIDNLVAKLEQIQEEREDVDVEYSAGVLTLAFPPIGTYVINKQPPNKQIWLSSPTSGPKRYDYVVVGEGQHEKEGGGAGDWIYIRDGSTLSELLLKEVGVDAKLDGTGSEP